jgi:hypothetical protein
MSAEEDEQRRRADLWYRTFQKKREERTPPPGRQRLARWLILAAALVLLALGLRWRGQRLQEVMGPAPGRDWAPLLSRELQLDDSSGALFFPLWEEWRRGAEGRAAERAALLKSLDELSAQHSELNAEQERLLERLRELEGAELEARRHLLEAMRGRLGLWRTARLRVLLEPPTR